MWQGHSVLTASGCQAVLCDLLGIPLLQSPKCKHALAMLWPQIKWDHNTQPKFGVQASGCQTHVLLGV